MGQYFELYIESKCHFIHHTCVPFYPVLKISISPKVKKIEMRFAVLDKVCNYLCNTHHIFQVYQNAVLIKKKLKF